MFSVTAHYLPFNFIAKNLNKVNKPSVHIDRKKEPIDKHKDINSRMKDVKYDRLA